MLAHAYWREKSARVLDRGKTMLIPLKGLQRKFKLRIGGVLHVGAHLAEELESYKACNCPVYWVEGNLEKYNELLQSLKHEPTNHVIHAIVADVQDKIVTFNIANNGHSSSILEMGSHLESHPEVEYIAEESRRAETLQHIIAIYKIPPTVNFLNLDIQGAELLALKGLGNAIKQIDYIYTEVNVKHLYKDCALITEIDAFLHEFERVKTAILEEYGWGDAFYIRKSLLPHTEQSTPQSPGKS